EVQHLDALTKMGSFWFEGSESFATFHILATIGNVFSAPYVCRSALFSGNGSGGRYISNEKLFAYVAQVASQVKLLMWGAKINSLIDRGQFWRLATSSLLHANLTHLALTSNLLDVVIMMQFNCFSLNSIGPMFEMLSGPRRYLAVYFSSARQVGECLGSAPQAGAPGGLLGEGSGAGLPRLRSRCRGSSCRRHLRRLGLLQQLLQKLGRPVVKRNVDNCGLHRQPTG
ncbi:hypothetical protein ACJX0J_013618, partial [Zea mays]